MNHTDAEVRSYLADNLSLTTFNTFAKILNMSNSIFVQIMDLLLDYRITVSDIANLTDFSDAGLTSFISTKQLQNNAYIPDAESAVDGQNYVLNVLGMKSLIEQGLKNANMATALNLFEYVPKVLVGSYTSPLYYKTMADLRSAFESKILPSLLSFLGCQNSIEEVFPTKFAYQLDPGDTTTPTIDSLFYGINGTYCSPAQDIAYIDIVDSTGNIATDASSNPIAGVEDFYIDASGNVVDPSGNIVDAYGNVVDASGNFVIDASGNLVDPSGNLTADASGHLIDSSGNIVDSSGNYVADASGNPVTVGRYVRDLGARIYLEIFGNFFRDTNYFSNDNLVSLLYRINKRLAKIEVECVAVNDVMNLMLPSGLVLGMANDLANDINVKKAYPDEKYMDLYLSSVETLDYRGKLSYSLNKFNFIDLAVQSYYQQTNNNAGYNQEMRQVLDIITAKVNAFKDLIQLNYQLSSSFLMTQ